MSNSNSKTTNSTIESNSNSIVQSTSELLQDFISDMNLNINKITSLIQKFKAENTMLEELDYTDFISNITNIIDAYDENHTVTHNPDTYLTKLNYENLNTYNNNKLNIVIEEYLLVLSADFISSGKVILKKLLFKTQELKSLAYVIVPDSIDRQKFQEDYYTEISKFLEQQNLLSKIINYPSLLKELIVIKNQQIIQELHLLLKNLSLLNIDSRQLILNYITQIEDILIQLLNCTNNIINLSDSINQ